MNKFYKFVFSFSDFQIIKRPLNPWKNILVMFANMIARSGNELLFVTLVTNNSIIYSHTARKNDNFKSWI